MNLRSALTRALDHPAARRVDSAAVAAAAALKGRPGVDRVAYVVSEAANHSILWHAINAVDAAVGGPTRRRNAVRRSVVLAVEQALVNGPVKMVAVRQRPIVAEAHRYTLRTPRTSSFPSGHASAAACSATLLTHDLGGAWLWWPLAAAVAWSRVQVGVHHGTDVLAGAGVGRVLALAALRADSRLTAAQQ